MAYRSSSRNSYYYRNINELVKELLPVSLCAFLLSAIISLVIVGFACEFTIFDIALLK
jgi:hypothetical protein